MGDLGVPVIVQHEADICISFSHASHPMLQIAELLAPSFKEATAAQNRQGIINLLPSKSSNMLTYVNFDEAGNFSTSRKPWSQVEIA